jgi:hypothetical protein
MLHVILTSIIHSTYLILLEFITLIVFEREFWLNNRYRRRAVVDFRHHGNDILDFTKAKTLFTIWMSTSFPILSLYCGVYYAMEYATIQYLADTGLHIIQT